MSEAIPRSHRPGYLNISGHTTVCQAGFFFKDISDWDVNDHTRYQRWVRGIVTDILGQKRDKIKNKIT